MRKTWMRLASAIWLTTLGTALVRRCLARTPTFGSGLPCGRALSFALAAACTTVSVIAIWKLFCADAREAMSGLRSELHEESTPLLIKLRRDQNV